jgi:hypothetical protein
MIISWLGKCSDYFHNQLNYVIEVVNKFKKEVLELKFIKVRVLSERRLEIGI